MANDVTFQHGDYAESIASWELVEHVCEGQSEVKEHGERYLPRPNPLDTSAENVERYKQYLARAVFYDVTGRTLQGLVGAAFRKWPVLEAPSALAYVADDIDGQGISIYQQSQETLGCVLKTGRHALLVDYPRTDAPASRADMASGLIRSTVVSLEAEQITNWRTAQIGALRKLALVVIRESHETVTADGFGTERETQYRVLRLTDAGYTQEIWRKPSSAREWALAEGPWVILDGSGRPWDEIPLTFVGAENNDSSVDRSPLYDLAELNIAHYRNSADYEDSAYLVGQAQPWMSGLSQEWRDWLQSTGIFVGSRQPILLPEGGAFGFAQSAANGLAKEAMDQKEAQMVALGARLIQPGSAIKTATEAQGDQEAEHSVLSLACSNVSEAYTKALGWMARFMAAPDTGIAYEVNQDFVEQHLDPQMLTALIQAWQAGQLPEGDLWTQLRKYGVIDPEKTDEAIREELDTQNPGLNLDANTMPGDNGNG